MATKDEESTSNRPTPGRRAWLVAAVLALLCGVSGALWWNLAHGSSGSSSKREPGNGDAMRIVSLSPGVTETIVALGASEKLVGVSDYCSELPGRTLRRAGSALTPNYEVIAELSPDAIVTSEVKGEMLAPLEKLAKTHRLPWLSLDEWQRSILTLGEILNRKKEAAELRSTVANTLEVPIPPGAPRVLFALDYGDSGSDETWFIRNNSIHGAVLRAAGGDNAFAGDVAGHPKLSPEQLLELDPDVIIVLSSNEARRRDEVQAHFGKWSPLRAVKSGKVGLVASPHALDVGPSVLKLVPLVKAELTRLGSQEPH